MYVASRLYPLGLVGHEVGQPVAQPAEEVSLLVLLQRQPQHPQDAVARTANAVALMWHCRRSGDQAGVCFLPRSLFTTISTVIRIATSGGNQDFTCVNGCQRAESRNLRFIARVPRRRR